MFAEKGAVANRYRKLLSRSLLSLWILAPAMSASAQGLSLDEALRQAEANSPTLSAANRQIGIAQGGRQQAGLIPNPELSWSMEDTRSQSSITSVQIAQPIELGGKRGARIDLAEKGQSAANVELERSKNELRANVIQAFYDSLLADMRVQLTQQSLQLAKRGADGARARVEAGKVSPVELTRAQVQLSEVDVELRRAQRDKANALARLQATLGQEGTPLSLEGDPTRLPKPPAVNGLWSRLDDTAVMRIARLSVDEQEASLALEKTQRIPDLTVSVGSQYDKGLRQRVNLVGLSMPIPLFNRNQGNILSASYRADQARDLRNATELNLRSDVQQAMDQWLVAMDEIEMFNSTILPSAKSAVDSATRGFEMGKFAFLDVLDAQRTLITARSNYVNALASATASWVLVERVYGDITALAASR
ncbi:TolC family protein [Pseudomonas sp. TTU2014-080ASC]|uniref:TolC family protein n=1 Tax=Pseudomonas sp. TTU2014-080ASC TaxID=1729724 RepID=UPI0007183664|nr:type I secretion protein TolC [Pseudomonas sp. TTU2014-080ASC]